MLKWHFIVPFYFGKNNYVVKKGGAPVLKKKSYLQKTIDSIKKLSSDVDITIYVCDENGYNEASTVHDNISRIDCHPRQLPIESVKVFQSWFKKRGSDTDIVVYNEDDQIIHLSENVKNDILNVKDRVVFSPHRWAKLFFLFRIKHRPLFKLHGKLGVLDNFDKSCDGKLYQYNCFYQAQTKRDAAYAANWYMKGDIFKSLDFNVPVEDIELESPSFQVYHTGIPVLKLANNKENNLADFIVDHLSGYDYNRRFISLIK